MKGTSMSKTLRPLSLLLLLALLAGCGFHPRGQTTRLDRLPQPLALTGIQPYSDLGLALREELRAAGVALTDDAQQAAAVLQISDARSDSRVLSLDSRNRAAEYELAESLRFSLRRPGQGAMVEPQLVRVIRTLYKPADQVLGRSREEEALRESMRRELAQKIIRRLAAQY
ncbi:MAG: hypothetical protein D6720_00510 [Gammaproteobacteria bacterium]|nr:MAG: hypothetical protein D6720_00510 [Gammaproteobacteria bacterium]